MRCRHSLITKMVSVDICVLLITCLSVFATSEIVSIKPCSGDEGCQNRQVNQTLICTGRECDQSKDLGQNCKVSEECVTMEDKNRCCDQRKKCACKNHFKFNETSQFCEETGCRNDSMCPHGLVCRNYNCVVKGIKRDNQPTPEAVFVVVAAILGGVVTVTVSVVVIKSRLFKRSHRKSTLSLLRND